MNPQHPILAQPQVGAAIARLSTPTNLTGGATALLVWVAMKPDSDPHDDAVQLVIHTTDTLTPAAVVLLDSVF